MAPVRGRRYSSVQRVAATVLVSALASNGCATTGALLQRESTAVSKEAAAAPQPSATYAHYVRSLPIGSRVNVALRSGERLDAVLIAVEESIVVLMPRTRIPEPERRVAMNEIARIELHASEGMGAGKAILIGVAAGGAAMLTILLITLSAGWD
jgi:hypothetical protein